MLNEMMDRPIVMPSVVEYMRTNQKGFYKSLDKLEKECNHRRLPIIPHETAVFLDLILDIIKPKNILEIGTAVGFSAILMAGRLDEDGKLITIERNPKMWIEAKKNIKDFGLDEKIKIMEGDASEVLVELDQKFDFIFMDSAKSKYIEFYPYCMSKLKLKGILLVDDIFQGGTILKDESEVPRRNRQIHRKLNEFLDYVHKDDSVKSSLIPLGDGLIMIEKIKEKDYF